MSENQEEVLEVQEDTQDQTTAEKEVVEEKPTGPVTQDEEGTIKVNLSDLNKPQEDAVQEQSSDDSDAAVGQPEDATDSEEVVEEIQDAEEEVSVLEEVTEEEVAEKTEELEEQVEQAIVEQEAGIELPENIQKVVDFMNETGGSLDDYVKLNTDYSKLNQGQLIREFYETTKPHLDKEDIDILMEDFSYDEELDEPRDIRKAKIAFKEEAAKAKKHLEGLKSKYYENIKAGSNLTQDQQKAVEFFNRYNKENEEATQMAESQKKIFLTETENVFNKNFKGFDYSVGDKKYRFKIKNTEDVKTTQSDINNFVKKFLNDKNQMSDAKGYHKSLFTAMNADAIANHFYEQGKADAVKESMSRTKNVDMDPRRGHEKVTTENGWTIRAVESDAVSTNSFRVKKRK
ncbi:hypothetical protein N9D22_05250 [Flavobacteriaceae bacterium]|nr:hypothetical protein [Flavobacteriaceae bacterium]